MRVEGELRIKFRIGKIDLGTLTLRRISFIPRNEDATVVDIKERGVELVIRTRKDPQP